MMSGELSGKLSGEAWDPLTAPLPPDIDDDWSDSEDDLKERGDTVSTAAITALLPTSQTLQDFITGRKGLGLSDPEYIVMGFCFLGQLLGQLHQQYDQTENSANFNINETSLSVIGKNMERKVILRGVLPASALQFYPDPQALWAGRTEYSRDDLAADAFSLGVVMLNYFGLVSYQKEYEAAKLESSMTQKAWEEQWVKRVQQSTDDHATFFIQFFQAADPDFCQVVDTCFGLLALLAHSDPQERMISDFACLSKYLEQVTLIIFRSLKEDSAVELGRLSKLDIPGILLGFIEDSEDSEDSEEEICGGGEGHAGAGAGFATPGTEAAAPPRGPSVKISIGRSMATAFHAPKGTGGSVKRKAESELSFIKPA